MLLSTAAKPLNCPPAAGGRVEEEWVEEERVEGERVEEDQQQVGCHSRRSLC